MDIVKKIIYFSVGIIMTVGFVVIGMSMYNKSKETIYAANSQYDDLMGHYSDIEYAMYDGSGNTASGGEIKSLINRLDDENVTIYVKNGSFLKSQSKDKEGVAYNCSAGMVCGYDDKNMINFEEAARNISDRSMSMYYINPNATFDAKLHRDENGIIDRLTFTQR
ncbi:MAG: hypothetical protein IJS80_07345 [Lachnospiraceae bacterium]|nr:hypothetical protein [Lachnospiraceae bacterium]